MQHFSKNEKMPLESKNQLDRADKSKYFNENLIVNKLFKVNSQDDLSSQESVSLTRKRIGNSIQKSRYSIFEVAGNRQRD